MGFKYRFRTTVDLGGGPLPAEGGGMSMRFQKLSGCLVSPAESDLPTLLIPPFNRENAVPDAVAGTWNGTSVDFICHCPEPVTRRAVGARCIGLVVESPHKDEFGGPDFTPLWPLNNKNTKQGIHDRFPLLISEAEENYGILAAPGADVVYINPVQFQASLARYMQNPDDGLLDAIRNAVWKALFGLPAVRNDFFSRLAAYRPAFLFIATTCKRSGQNGICGHPYGGPSTSCPPPEHPQIPASTAAATRGDEHRRLTRPPAAPAHKAPPAEP